METGFYHRHTRRGEPPDVYIAEGVPALIVKVYPWIHAAESEYQHQVNSPGVNHDDKARISEKLTNQLVRRLDPNDDAVWVDGPHWVKHLKPA